MSDDLVPMLCPAEVLDLLAEGLTGFSCIGGAPDWLLTGVWLMCGGVAYLASPSVEVLSDGLVAWPLVIDAADAVRRGIEDALPDIQRRLLARGSHVVLPDRLSAPEPPPEFQNWPAGEFRMTVLLRLAGSVAHRHRIACALLFRSQCGRSLLIGTDRSTLAMVMSEGDDLIDRYLKECDEVSAAEYCRLAGG